MPKLDDHAAFGILGRFDTPTVLNVIELFGVRPRSEGFMDGRIRACFPRMPAIVGYAATATFRGAREAGKGDAYSSIADQVECFLRKVPAPRIVVFEDLDGQPVAATFGEVMCTVYRAFGCLGLITSGAARDLDQVERLGFPCWSSSVIASHGYARIVDSSVPVMVGGVRVQPGDVLHADRNGVATIPREILAEVALGCQKLAEAENEIINYARGGSPDVAGLRAAQTRCRDLFGKLPEDVRREARKELRGG